MKAQFVSSSSLTTHWQKPLTLRSPLQSTHEPSQQVDLVVVTSAPMPKAESKLSLEKLRKDAFHTTLSSTPSLAVKLLLQELSPQKEIDLQGFLIANSGSDPVLKVRPGKKNTTIELIYPKTSTSIKLKVGKSVSLSIKINLHRKGH